MHCCLLFSSVLRHSEVSSKMEPITVTVKQRLQRTRPSAKAEVAEDGKQSASEDEAVAQPWTFETVVFWAVPGTMTYQQILDDIQYCFANTSYNSLKDSLS